MDQRFTSTKGGAGLMDIPQEMPLTSIRAEDEVAQRIPEEVGGYVLIVGTDQRFLAYYRDIFQRLGFTPLAGTSYESAVASLRLVVFDFIVVPQSRLVFEGRFVMEDDWMLNDRTCVLIITKANGSDRRLGEPNLGGTVEYLRDPVAVPEMVRAITTHLQSSAVCQGALR